MRFATFAFVASLVVLVLGANKPKCGSRNAICHYKPGDCCNNLVCGTSGRCESPGPGPGSGHPQRCVFRSTSNRLGAECVDVLGFDPLAVVGRSPARGLVTV
ncbi:hypothetical protein PAXRUDRAFT_255056 [Paxillus rubicundulus Ve08.2h10]|uniref:Hydrophobin n=1 Tax=Paxillus rubicundulus Ve08.2h10 TaxID=930991 RepID=A0A0D0DFW6_9AGAM|nr:hypothetical protein PAXRUDRAFT_255056 [Paxillus rubicundulus Ve08.2h10]